MTLNIKTIQTEVTRNLNPFQRIPKDFSDLKNWPMILGKQCLYVMDWQHGTLSFTRGVEAMLGYDELNGEVFQGVQNFHPEDTLIINRIIRGMALHCVKNQISANQEFLNICYRLRKKDGTYIRVLRQSGIYEVDNDERLISNWSYLTDISFMTNNNKVEWDIHASNLDVQALRKGVFREFSNFFTKREIQLIKSIAAGCTNAQIAGNLHISIHTVSTHRKNILRKSQCSNTQELLEFCHKNGIL